MRHTFFQTLQNIVCLVLQGIHLWGTEYFTKGPHQRTVYPHKLLHVYLICLIENYSDFVIMSLQCADDLYMVLGLTFESVWTAKRPPTLGGCLGWSLRLTGRHLLTKSIQGSQRQVSLDRAEKPWASNPRRGCISKLASRPVSFHH